MNHTAHGKTDRRALLYLPLLLLVFLLLLTKGSVLSDAAYESLTFAARKLIPSMFLFAVFSKIASRIPFPQSTRVIPCLHLPLSALPALFIGLFTGFPMGAYAAKTLCDNRTVSEKSAHHLAAYANNASLGFLLFTVAPLYQSRAVGLLLFFSGTLASLLVGAWFAPRAKAWEFLPDTAPLPPFFTLFCDAVVSASEAMLSLTGYLTLFGVLSRALFLTALPSPLITVLLLFLEPTAAIRHLVTLPPSTALPLSAFALGFSGFSILAQSMTVWENRLPLARVALKRIMIGLLSAFFVFIFQKIL